MFLEYIFMFVVSIGLAFIEYFIIENAEVDFIDIKKILSFKFYKNEVFCLNFKEKEKVIKIFLYFIFNCFVCLFLFRMFFISIETFFHFLIFILFFMLSIIDIKFRIVPDTASVLFVLVAALFSYWNPYIHNTHNHNFIFIFFISGFVALIISLLIYFFGYLLFKKEAIGMGDIKLFFCVGLLFGISGFFIILFYSFLLSSVFTVFYLTFRKCNKDIYIPFVPFIALSVYWFIFLKYFHATIFLF